MIIVPVLSCFDIHFTWWGGEKVVIVSIAEEYLTSE